MRLIEVGIPPRPAGRDGEAFPLQDVAQPNLLPEVFPPSQAPRIAFDGRSVPKAPPMDVWIVDASFRNGQAPLAPDQALLLYGLLHRLGGPRGVIRQTEFPLATEADRETVRLCKGTGHPFPEPTAWIRSAREEIGLVKAAGLKEAGFPTPVSDFRIFQEQKQTRKAALRTYLEGVDAALDAGILPRCHLEDVTRADLHGFVVPFAIALMKRARQAEIPVKVRLCDTLGYGVTHEGAALPRSVQKLVHALTEDAAVPAEWLEWQGQNGLFKALPNAGTAWLYGAGAACGSLMGLGEGGGNAAIEGLIFEYLGLKGEANGLNPAVLAEIVAFYRLLPQGALAITA